MVFEMKRDSYGHTLVFAPEKKVQLNNTCLLERSGS